MAVKIFMMDKTCQGIVVYLNTHRKTLEKLGLNSVLSKSTIYGASARISQSYYRQMHFHIVTSMPPGDLARDSSGFPMRKFIPRFSVQEISHAQEGVAQTTHHNRHTHPRHARLYNHARIQADTPVMKDILARIVRLWDDV